MTASLRTARAVGLACGAMLSLLAVPSIAHAWSCQEPGCVSWCEAPTYRIGRLSADLEAAAAGATLVETQRAMTDWSLVSCTGLESSYGGRHGGETIEGDGVSSVEFVDQGWPYGDVIIGLTTHVTAGGCLIESDIQMNGENFDFVTRPGFQTEVNAYSTLLHEAGHFYGLGHSQYAIATMYFRYGSGTLELRTDDEQGICFLYPGEDPPPDCAVTGCPRGRTCLDGICVDTPPEACTSDSDCVSVQRCNLASGRCENRPVEGTDIGTACNSDDTCSSGICLVAAPSSYCSQTCDALDPWSCPTGFHCSGEAAGDCAVGVCLLGGGGATPFGGSCDEATDCGTLFCGDGRCTVPCDRSEDAPCPLGNVCHPSRVGACGVCGSPLAMGEPCEDADQCASNLCYDPELDGGGYCTALCSDDSACTDGFVCVALGSDSVCMPRGRVEGGACSASARAGRGLSAWTVLALSCAALVRRAALRRSRRGSRKSS